MQIQIAAKTSQARLPGSAAYFDLAASFFACFSFGVSFGLFDFPFRFCSLFAIERPPIFADKFRQPDCWHWVKL